jgi:hypothetical protein
MLIVPLDCPFLLAHSVFSNIYLSCVLCTQCWQYLWIIHSWSPPRFSLTSTWPVSCVINVASVSALSILHCTLGFLYCLFVLCLVYSMLTGPLDCPFLIVPSVFSNIYFSSVLCIQCRQVSLHYPFLIVNSVFSNVYLSYVLCTQCWQCLWIVHSWLPIRFSLIFICPVSCVLKVDSTSGLSILGRPLGFL